MTATSVEDALPRVLAIVGPTASGKSRLAVWMAERLGWPVLCCDSVQVYRGLDIGSAKAGPELRARVPHHLIDLVDPDEEFNAGDYAKAALAQLARGPGLFVGGTGFYLRAAAWTYSGDVELEGQDQAFTAGWEAREREAPGSVHAELARVDAITAAAIHPRNVVRSLRALWLCEVSGRPISEVRAADPPRQRLRLGLVVLEPAVPDLDRAIGDRCAAMLRDGLVAEVEMLRRGGYDARHKSMRSLGYRQILSHLDGHMRLDEALADMCAATRHYARRQRTYFRNQLLQSPAGSDAVGSGASGSSDGDLRVTVTTPLWDPGVDLARETASWWPQVEAFLHRVDGGA